MVRGGLSDSIHIIDRLVRIFRLHHCLCDGGAVNEQKVLQQQLPKSEGGVAQQPATAEDSSEYVVRVPSVVRDPSASSSNGPSFPVLTAAPIPPPRRGSLFHIFNPSAAAPSSPSSSNDASSSASSPRRASSPAMPTPTTSRDSLDVPANAGMRRLSAGDAALPSPAASPQSSPSNKKQRKSFLNIFMINKDQPPAKVTAPAASKSSLDLGHKRSKSTPWTPLAPATAPAPTVPAIQKPATSIAPAAVASSPSRTPSPSKPATKIEAPPAPAARPRSASPTFPAPAPAPGSKPLTKLLGDPAAPPPNNVNCLPRPHRTPSPTPSASTTSSAAPSSTAPSRKPTVNSQGKIRRKGAYGRDKLTRVDSFSSIYSIEPVRSYSLGPDDEDGIPASPVSPPETPRATGSRLPFHSLPRRRDTDASVDSPDAAAPLVLGPRGIERVPTLKRIRTLRRAAAAPPPRSAREALLETYADIVSELAELVPGERRRVDLGASAADAMERLLAQYAEAAAAWRALPVEGEDAEARNREAARREARERAAVSPFTVEFKNELRAAREGAGGVEDEEGGGTSTVVEEYVVEHWLPLSPVSSGGSTSGSDTLPMSDPGSPLEEYLAAEGFAFEDSDHDTESEGEAALAEDEDDDDFTYPPDLLDEEGGPRRGSDATVVPHHEQRLGAELGAAERWRQGRRVLSIVRRVVTLDRRGVPESVKVDICPMVPGEVVRKEEVAPAAATVVA
ncbi:hypothetical protein HDU96_010212 [Phlyctochytrium bullatum]|nr:hypothetical protein HDU96_010212 [Phlyctochytrium bullatum]